MMSLIMWELRAQGLCASSLEGLVFFDPRRPRNFRAILRLHDVQMGSHQGLGTKRWRESADDRSPIFFAFRVMKLIQLLQYDVEQETRLSLY